MVTSSDPGIYNLNLIDLFCEDTLQHVIHFLVTPQPHLPIIDSICFGESYSFSILNSNEDFNYAWINNIGDTIMTGDSLHMIKRFISRIVRYKFNHQINVTHYLPMCL